MEQDKDKKDVTVIEWPDRPAMETGNYVEQTEAQIAQAQKYAAEQERRAKRERDMAILSDIANLVTKGAAMHGGAWKIDKEEARSAVANEKLRALRESNSKQLAEYARMRVAAQDAQRKERNAEKKAVYDAAVDKAKLEASIAERNARLQEVKEHNDAMEAIAKQNADTKETVATNKKGNTSGGGGKTTTGDSKKEIRYIDGWAFNINSPAEVDEAYAKMVQADPNKAAKKRDEYGDLVFNDNPNTAQKRDALTKGGMTKVAPKRSNNRAKNNGKKAGFTTGKKAGFNK
jgi:hypothetical protein